MRNMSFAVAEITVDVILSDRHWVSTMPSFSRSDTSDLSADAATTRLDTLSKGSMIVPSRAPAWPTCETSFPESSNPHSPPSYST